MTHRVSIGKHRVSNSCFKQVHAACLNVNISKTIIGVQHIPHRILGVYRDPQDNHILRSSHQSCQICICYPCLSYTPTIQSLQKYLFV